MSTVRPHGHVFRLVSSKPAFHTGPSKYIRIIIPLESHRLILSREESLVQQGDIIKVKPDDPFSLILNGENVAVETTTAYIYEFDPSFFDGMEWGEPFLTGDSGVLRTSAPTVMNYIGLTEILINEIETNRLFKDDLVHYNLKIICIHLYRTRRNYDQPDETTNSTEDAILFETITNYINAHYQETLTNKELSKLFYVSEKKLTTLFKKYGKMTPQKFVAARRLKVAIDFIRDGLSITEAVGQAGYKNYSTFYRQFVKNFGESPDDYFNRKNHV
ncbi:AraC family transcriptional regulator [Aerococcaceae bacterium DSM 111176]|nr:AraC family transcriptional regulator [Aerococcaceae bacterium DSM 111176]